MLDMSELCSAKVYDRNCLTSRTCCLRGKVERDGKLYCGIHDPVAVAEKREEIGKKWRDNFHEERRIAAQSKLRATAGEMGIELAKWIIGFDPGFNLVHWTVRAKAQAVIDKLAGK